MTNNKFRTTFGVDVRLLRSFSPRKAEVRDSWRADSPPQKKSRRQQGYLKNMNSLQVLAMLALLFY